MLFEVSWEVCSQAGGIYTVLRSKAPFTARDWGDHYWLIGPYREQSAKIEFEAHRPPPAIAGAIAELEARGVRVHAGRWLITGRPHVLLIDVDSVQAHVAEMKYYLWKDLAIGTPAADRETDAIVAFGYTVTDLLQAIERQLRRRPIVAQFHEWQGGVAVPLLKFRGATIPTIFTTHATLIGRSLSAANVDLYERLGEYDPEAIADEHGVGHRYRIERAAARDATVFTTVSEITAQESEVFLGRAPEVLLPNGLNVERFAAPHEFQNLHQQCKEQIHDFVMGHFFPSYTFDLSSTLYVFTAGRYEYRNKGFDIFIEALYELNRRLKAHSEGITVVAFIITRAPCRGMNIEALNRQAMFNELRDTCRSIREDMGRALFQTVAQGRLPALDDLLDEYARIRLKRMMHGWIQGGQPTIVTHDLEDDLQDPILCHLRKRQLFNAPDDPVKVVYHPDFITSVSPIFGIEYDHFVRGCNLGVFPSYYEPWGYTPMECIIRGVPAITSDLSGFGAYVMDRFPDHDAHGMFVARRRRVSAETSVYQVANWLHGLTRTPLRERIAMRNSVESYAEEFDWNRMGTHYMAAYRRALDAFYPGKNLLSGVSGSAS